MIKKLLNIKRILIENVLSPLYHSYLGCRVFNAIDRLSGYKIERYQFYKALGYYPNLKNPQSYNEKIVWKKLHDRNPLLPIVQDKYRARDYIIEVLGEKEAKKILIPLLYVTDKPKNIPFDALTGEYVIKPNHSSGKIILAEKINGQKRFTIVENDKSTTLPDNEKTRNEVIKVCRKWLASPFGYHNNEWAYQKIKRKILVERLLRDSSGKIPTDYKFSVLNGKVNRLSVWYHRFIDLRIAIYTPDWDYLERKGPIKQAEYRKKPENLRAMIDLAKLLAKPFDSIRVDLYLVDHKIYFGEFTNYAASGRIPFNSIQDDYKRGSEWELVPEYWKS